MKKPNIDTQIRKKGIVILTVLIVVPILAVLLGSAPFASAAPPEPRELPGLREAPDIPVRSIILRRHFPDHPGRLPPQGGKGCDKDVDLTSTLSGVVAIAAQDNIICTNADLDTYIRGSNTFVVQAGGDDAAWTHTDVSDPANPVTVGQFKWAGGAGKNTYTPDLKTFRQSANDYIVMGLERITPNAFCGVVIVNVNDPGNPVIESQFIGNGWCDTHNVFVEDDANGDGQYIYTTADAPNDMRVLDISGVHEGSVSSPVEIGRYTSPTANNDNYVHDITVIDHGDPVGRRAYLAYWNTGVVILNATDVTPGTNPTPIVGPNELDPPGFLAHHAFASQDGSLVFTQDEFLNATGDEPVQMWDVSGPASPTHVDGLVLGTDVPVNPAHNLEIRYDINPNRLYVGWYKMGLQAWDFTSAGFDHSANPVARTAVQYHQVQTETADDAYSGAWGVRLERIGANTYIFTSDRNFGLIVDCVGCSQAVGTVTGTVTDNSNVSPIAGATVSTDTEQSDTTDAGGHYTLSDVPTGSRTITASVSGYVTQGEQTTVTEGLTTVVDFALDPEPEPSGTGSVKGKVTNAATGRNLGGVTVEIVGTGPSDTSNNGGRYSINDVTEGQVTVSASKLGFATQEKTVNVVAGQLTALDFALAPE